jgi:preprotein translocase subunit SecA
MLAEYFADAMQAEDSAINELFTKIKLKFAIEVALTGLEGLSQERIKEALLQKITAAYEAKEKSLGADLMRQLEYSVFLQIIDSKWKDHLYAMDTLREGIGLRAYGQRDPLIEYKREAFEMFSHMIASIEDEATEAIFKLQPVRPERMRGVFSSISQELLHPEAAGLEQQARESTAEEFPDLAPQSPQPHPAMPQKAQAKVGRNDPCPCGAKDLVTGNPIKYKKCHGK